MEHRTKMSRKRKYNRRVTTSINMEQSDREWLQSKAEREGTDIGAIVRRLVREAQVRDTRERTGQELICANQN
jgi:hypothetical protein